MTQVKTIREAATLVVKRLHEEGYQRPGRKYGGEKQFRQTVESWIAQATRDPEASAEIRTWLRHYAPRKHKRGTNAAREKILNGLIEMLLRIRAKDK